MPRTGTIVLARHGEPDISRTARFSPAEYATFWAAYEEAGLAPGQVPPDVLRTHARAAGILISSIRPRAVESARAVAEGREFARDALFVEAPLPPPRLPRFIRLSPRAWGFLARFWWWFFNHHDGQETRDEARTRAERAADLLESHAAGGGDVVLLAHGFFNYMIGDALRRRGWRLARSEGWKYWSIRRFERK